VTVVAASYMPTDDCSLQFSEMICEAGRRRLVLQSSDWQPRCTALVFAGSLTCQHGASPSVLGGDSACMVSTFALLVTGVRAAHSVRTYPTNDCLGWRPTGADGKPGPFTWMSYAETGAKVDAIAGAFAHVGLQPKGRVGIFGANSPEWMIAMQVRAFEIMSAWRLSLHA
jgi:acyl-CoA synthetase (AMP-forming)/AMP-acid ligase II